MASSHTKITIGENILDEVEISSGTAGDQDVFVFMNIQKWTPGKVLRRPNGMN